MSERGNFRSGGGGRGGRGGDRGGDRGGKGGGRGGGGAGSQSQEKPKKENILDLSKYMDKEVNVKFNGGREGEFASVLVARSAAAGGGGEDAGTARRLCLLNGSANTA